MFSAVISMGFDGNGKRVQKRITANTKWEVQKIADELVTNKIDIASQELTVEQAMIEYVECRSNLIKATTLRNYNERYAYL